MPENNVIAQTMAILGINYNPAIASTEAMNKEIQKLNAQILALQKNASTIGGIMGANMARQVLGDKVIYDQYGRTLSVIGANTREIERATRTATQTARQHKQTVKDLTAQYSILGSQFERRASWFLAGTAFFGSITAAAAAVRTIAEVEMGMVQIARITEDVTFNFKEMRNELLQLGQDYGMTWKNVHDIALRWSQAGYDVKDTIELTKDSLLALNTAELNAEQSTSGLIAIMAQWNMTADQLLPTIDKINKTADDWAVTSQDLVDGLNRSSGAAKVLGMSLDETIAVLTVMREATGRTGKEVGNALNSILSFMQRDVALNAFAREGIAVWADEAHTQFRNVIDIFDEVAARWPEMSDISRDMFVEAADQAGLYSEELAEVAGTQKEFNDLQQRDLSQAMAGIYRRNYLLALLQNWAKVDRVLIGMEDSLGYSMRENERTMQALAKQWESLKAAAQELAVAIGDAGLLNQLKGLVDGAKDAITWFNQLDPHTQSLIIHFIEVTAAIKLFGAAMGILGAGNVATLLSGWAVSATQASAATRVLSSTAAGLGTVLTNVGRGVTAFFGGPLGLALALAATAFFTFRNSVKESEAALKELNKSAEQAVSDSLSKQQQWERESEFIKDMTEQYIALQQKIESGDLTEKELQAAKKESAEISEAVKIALGEEAAARLDAAGWTQDAVNQEISVLTDKMRQEREATLNTIKQQIAQTQSVIDNANARIEALRQEGAAIEGILKLEQAAAKIGAGTYSAGAGLYEGLAAGAENLGLDWVAERYRAAAETHRKAAEERMDQFQKVVENETAWQISQFENTISAAQAELTKLRSVATETTPTERTTTPGYVGGTTNQKTTSTDSALRDFAAQYQDFADMVTSFLDQYNNAIQQTDNAIGRLNTQQQILDQELQNVTIPTLALISQQQDQYSQSIKLNTEKQITLHAAAEEGRAKLANLKAVMADLNQQYESGVISAEEYDAAMEKISPAIQQLTQDVDSYGNAWWDAELNIRTAQQALANMNDEYAEKVYNNATKVMQHEVAMARMSTQEQIEYLRQLETARVWSVEYQWEIEEELFQKYKQGLSDQMDAIKDAYDERLQEIEDEIEAEDGATKRKIANKQKEIEAIEESTNAQIEAIRALMDALDDEQEASDREEAEYEHNQKMAELQEQYNYESVRTGLEHQENMADLLKQMAEEERDWAEKKEKWARDDQKDIYQDQIDALEKQADARKEAIQEEIDDIEAASAEKKRELQDYYNDVQKLLSDKNLEMIASLAATEPQYYNTFLNLMKAAEQGLRDGSSNLTTVIDEIKSNISGATSASSSSKSSSKGSTGGAISGASQKVPIATIGPSQYEEVNGTTYMWSRQLASILGKSVDWNDTTQMVKIGSKWFSPWKVVNDRAYVGIRQVAEALGYKVEWNDPYVNIYPKAHTGAYIAQSGVAELLKGERVLSPQLTVSFDRMAQVLANFPSIPDRIAMMGQGGGGVSDAQVDRLVAAIEKRKGVQINTLFHADSVGFEDTADMDIFSRRMARSINSLSTARGRG